MMRWAATAAALAYCCSIAALLASAESTPIFEVDRMNVLEYDIDAAYTKFEFDVKTASLDLTKPLVLEVQVNTVDSPLASDIVLNGQKIETNWSQNSELDFNQPATLTHTLQSFLIPDILGHIHDVDVSLYGNIYRPPHSPHDGKQSIQFRIESIDGIRYEGLGLAVVMRPTTAHRLAAISVIHDPTAINFDDYSQSFVIDRPAHHDELPFDSVDSSDMDADDMNADVQSLIQLEAEAADLQARIAIKKQRISKCLKKNREQIALRELLDQCDGIVCAARVIAQRICDKIGINTLLSPDDLATQRLSEQQQTTLAGNESAPLLGSSNSTRKGMPVKTVKGSEGSRPAAQPSHAMPDLSSGSPFTLSDAVISALGMIAAALGLTALCSFLRRRFSSARTQVERAADDEERNNARAYHRAARRALYRKRWDALVAALSISKSIGKRPPLQSPYPSTYDEKRALILQDALLEQDTDIAEKGEVMEAEIRELRHAHEIVSSLVRVDEHRFAATNPPRHDPPPPFVPLPYTPSTRSRASTGTLPSYNSECLPGYTSAPLTDTSSRRSNSISSSADDFIGYESFNTAATTLFSSQDEPRPLPTINAPNSVAESRCTRYTPTSSVVDVSPRPSQETLRTRGSRDGQ